MSQLISSGSGNTKDGGNVCHVHHQGQFFQRVILLLLHLVSFLPCWESKLVCEWPRRITQSKFFILIFFTPPRWVDAAFAWRRPARMRGQHAKPHTSARRAPHRRANGCADERFVVQPSTFRPEAALGSGFSLQAAFWYQNAMLALFLYRKKNLKRSLRLMPPLRTSQKIWVLCTLDSVVATLVAMKI